MHFRLLKAAATAALESIKEAKERKREREQAILTGHRKKGSGLIFFFFVRESSLMLNLINSLCVISN